MKSIKNCFFLALKCILLAQNILGYEVRVDASSAASTVQLVKLDPPGKQSDYAKVYADSPYSPFPIP